MKVNWKPIDLDEAYRISSDGRVESRRRCGKKKLYPNYLPMKLQINHGYPHVHIFNKFRKVHQLVLEAFVGPRPPGYEAAHLNGIRSDNRVENLKWVTKSENQNHRKLHGTEISVEGEDVHWAKLSKDEVLQIKQALKNKYHGLGRKLARQFNVTPATISYINKGHTWKSVEKKYAI